MMRLSNKSAIVTGGSSGIGLAIAKRFHDEGAHVMIFDLAAPAEQNLLDSDRIVFHKGDVTKSGDVADCVAAAKKVLGRVDILVNNAGIIRDHMIWRMTEEEYDSVMAVNLKGPWLMCREVAPLMRQQEYGRIVNIASRSWLGNRGQSNYSSSKAGLVGLTRVMALELAPSKVTANAVAPGLIDTPLTRALPEDVFQKLVNAQPGNEAGSAEDVAAAVAFLASDEAGFISGQVLHVDGGKSIGAST